MMDTLPPEIIDIIAQYVSSLTHVKDSDPLSSKRHRLHALYNLCLVSQKFKAAFTCHLHSMPLVINTHDRKSCCRYHNTARFWREHVLVNYVKQVTLWHPQCFMDTRLADLVLPESLP